MKIFVGNIDYKIDNNELESYFAPYGQVENVKIVFDRETKRSKGFGFVEMPNDAEARNAISELDGKQVNNRNLSA
jgi:RNA recognition motif-containing protein